MREKKKGMEERGRWEKGKRGRETGKGESYNGVESLWKLQNAVYKRECYDSLTDHPSEEHSKHLIAECEMSVQ